MKYSNLKEEKKLWKKGYKQVACLDEVGRGPLAGPVVAVAVTTRPMNSIKLALRDSKKLTAIKREKLYRILTNHPAIEWGVGWVSAKVIDRINIYRAVQLAMKRAIKNLEKKAKRKIQFLILDGNFSLPISLPQKSIVNADEKVFSCSAASIIAKVKRDRTMIKYHKKYPQYGFDRHKGYGTKAHIEALRKFGSCPIHRQSFLSFSIFPIAKFARS